MLELKCMEQAETVPQAKTMIGRQIAALDAQIDRGMYQMYNLIVCERKPVEGVNR
ncbi:hypothetical protein FACS189461_4040 [Spirochaetia bacterium]|nr:hypothetical protein FACS189461_4040 [Spirochaetia bacterium]